MEYNTSRPLLNLKEYGRNIQKIVEIAKNIKDKEERNAFAESLVGLMGHLNPHLKIEEDYKHKLWDHLHIISDFELDVDSPYPKPSREEVYSKPDHIGYPKTKIRYKHYGKNVERLIEKSMQTQKTETRESFNKCIGNYMKMAYSNWSYESVNDEVIKADLEKLSGGMLSIPEEVNLITITKSSSNQGSSKRKNNKGGSRKSGKRKPDKRRR